MFYPPICYVQTAYTAIKLWVKVITDWHTKLYLLDFKKEYSRKGTDISSILTERIAAIIINVSIEKLKHIPSCLNKEISF